MEYEEIVKRFAREIDLGKDMENILSTLARDYGVVLEKRRWIFGKF